MNNDLDVSVSTNIQASPAEVWQAITNPELIRKYFFGTDVTTDWKKGSPIIYKGIWEGKPYEDKGTVLEVIPEKLLLTNFLSASSGTPDVPANYHIVKYELKPENNGTTITVTQDNNKTEEMKSHSEQNWKMVLDGMKKMLEVK